jgi:hypothetical protein
LRTVPSYSALNTLLGCPRCGAKLIRVRRSSLDRVLSIFSPRRRFRCTSPECEWEGVIKNRHAERYAYSASRNPIRGPDHEN